MKYFLIVALIAYLAVQGYSLRTREKRGAGNGGCYYNCTDASWCNSTITSYAQCSNDPNIMTSCPCLCKILKVSYCGDNANWCTSYVRAATDCTPSVNQTCCKSCSRYSTAGSSCVDKANWCSSYAASCGTDNNVKSQCCQTCSKSTNNINPNSCVDTASWCSSYVYSYPSSCSTDSNVARQCCQSCSTYSNKAETCTDASWCSSYVTSSALCYSVESSCCKTCSRRKTGNSACKYGDKYSWCGPAYCGTNRNECCASCP